MIIKQIAIVFVTVAILSLSVSALTCQDPPLSSLPFCDPSLTSDARAKDLVSRMSIDQKQSVLDNEAADIPELAIIGFNYWTECLHGALLDGATSFPAPVGLGATFNTSSVHEMAKAISTEVRAFSNKPNGTQHLTCWAPNVNLQAHVLWGRNQETPGEDPYLTSEYVKAYVTGIQEIDKATSCLKAVSTCKHYLGYNVETNPSSRFGFNAKISHYDLENTYLPAFRQCVESGVRSVMCSYNAINSIPACADAETMQNILRDEFGFDGFVVSDCGAISQIVHGHHWVISEVEAVAAAMKAGCDLNCGSDFGKYTKEAVEREMLDEKVVDVAVERAFRERFVLGMFDTPAQCGYQNIPPTSIDLPETRELATQLARESLVLIKNEGDALPIDVLKQNISNIAVIGPTADDPNLQLSNYHGKPPFTPVTPLAQLKNEYPNIGVKYAQGCTIIGSHLDVAGVTAAVDASDIAVVFLGLDPDKVESEGRDRTDLLLPGRQRDLLETVVQSSAASNKRVIVVIMHGGAIGDEKLYALPNAVLDAFYPGELGGVAIVEALFGTYNPGGRLPHTIYPSQYVDLINPGNMDMATFPGMTYRYLQIYPLYEFGHGLSYTTFNVTWTSGQRYEDGNVVLKATVKNTGDVAGDDVVLAMAKGVPPMIKQLIGFKRVHLAPGEEVEVSFDHKSKNNNDNGVFWVRDVEIRIESE